MIKLDQAMPFGKHKGKIVRELAQTNYNYILWCKRELGTEFSDGVIYIAKYESRASASRQLAWAYGQSCKRKWRDWSKIKDKNPVQKAEPDKIDAADFYEPEEQNSHEPDYDEYAGMTYSDFGNN